MTAYINLCKLRISLLASLSAAAGFALSPFHAWPRLIPLISGVFILACGACALNQYQERDLDALMPRTCNRPLPSGEIRPLNALLFSVFLLTSGFFMLLLTFGFKASAPGLFAVVWYNGVYTFLKKKTAFAAIPGALTGAAPPAIGWIAGGGMPSDPHLLTLCFFFFMWQVPHFWLLIFNYGDEYKRAGLPSVTGVFTRAQLLRIIFIWIICTSVSGLLISANKLINSAFINFILVYLSAWLVWCGAGFLRDRSAAGPLFFRKINIYMFAVLVLIFAGALLV
jgi:protoheme IX farnesyltransferase